MARNNIARVQSSTQKLSDTRIQPSTAQRAPSYSFQYAQPLATELVVDQQQSLELVRTIISAAISNVTWIRDVFPNDCYESRVYDFSDPDPSYEAFMKGGKPFTLEKNQNLAYWRVLVRGSDPGVDKFLDWLEIGVSDALKRKYLSTLQLSFYDNEIKPSALMEAYVVSITYDNGVPSMQLDSQSRNGKKNIASTLLLSDAKLGIRNLINGIIVSAQDLPGELPSNHLADMHLTYNDMCPKDFNPPGFRACNNPNFIVNGKLTTRSDSLSTGHHGIQVRLFSQCRPDDEPIVEESATADPHSFGVHKCSPRPAVCVEETNDGELSTLINEAINSRKVFSTTRDTDYITHSVPILDSQNAVYFVQPYSQAVKLRIERARQHRDALLIPGVRDGVYSNQKVGQNVSCECGVSTSDDLLLRCNICNNFQHSHCYGYLSTPPSFESVCYTCLLEGENILISEMKNLCMKRRTLWHLRGRAPVSGKELARFLKCGETKAKNLLEHLEQDDMVKRSQRRKKRGKFGEFVFTIIENEAKLQRDYFCPILNIAHHLAYMETPGGSSLLPAQTVPQHQPVLTTHLTPSQPSLNPSIPRRGNEQRHPLRTTFLDGSSTQGTPTTTPTPAYFLSPDLDAHQTVHTPQLQTRPMEMDTRDAPPQGKKRAGDAGLDGASRKHLKVSSARSPWLFGRVADKASLSG